MLFSPKNKISFSARIPQSLPSGFPRLLNASHSKPSLLPESSRTPSSAENSGKEWEEYMEDTLGVDQEEYDEQIDLYAKELVKQEMIIYAIAEKEDLSVTDEEYDQYLENMLASSNFEDEKAFKEYTGMSLKKYAETYKLDRDLLLTKELDKIYDRLTGVEESSDDGSSESEE
jgi:trigger factor